MLLPGLHLVVLVTLLGPLLAYEERFRDHYTDEFGIELEGDAAAVQDLARTHGLEIKRQITALGNVFVVNHKSVSSRSKRSAIDLLEQLKSDPRVKFVEQQKVLHRTKRRILHDKQWELPINHYKDKSVYQRYASPDGRLNTKDRIPGVTGRIRQAGFNDPFFPDQWYLVNEGQTGGNEGYDVNVLPVWEKGITGEGVVVSILDDGIDHNHPDLQRNYDPKASADMNDRTDSANDPMPNIKDSSNSHGTRCAGEVAAQANNSNCGVGIAFNAKIGGVRMLDGAVTDLLEAEALTYHKDYVHIYSASWGPSDDGKTVEGPGTFAAAALKTGIEEGRDGKGSIYVWATGNGGMVEDDCNCDGYVSSIYTLSVGCISDKGLSTYFSEMCPSTIAVIYTGGAHEAPGIGRRRDNPKIKVVTTDLDGDCTLEFQGTSSAAPLAAGCFALVLEANPDLTWRDLQNIVVQTARVPNAEEEGWTVNGAGHHVNNKFGFGAIDCGKMVEVAQNWKTVPEQHQCTVEADNPEVDIIAGSTVNQSLETNGCHGHPNGSVTHLEHVQIEVVLEHKQRGDLSISLYSPSGTISEILSIRPLDKNSQGLSFTFMTVHNWGEDPQGTWTLSVSDLSDRHKIFNGGSAGKRGKLKSWSLILWGWGDDANSREASLKRGDGASGSSEPAHTAQEVELKHIMAQEGVSSENVQITEQAEAAVKSTEKKNQATLSEDDIRFLEDIFEDNPKSSNQIRDHANRRMETKGRFSKWNQHQKLRTRNKFTRNFQDLEDHHYDDLLSNFKRMLGKNNDDDLDALNVHQRSLLDDAIAEILPPKGEKEDDKEEANESADEIRENPARTEDDLTIAEYDKLLSEIDELLKILDE